MIKIIILSLICLIIDQITKILVIKLIPLSDSVVIIKNFFYIIPTNNTGAAFSILIGQRIFLILITIAILAFLIQYIKKNKIERKIDIISFSFIIGGSLGNLIDRIIRGSVIDFISLKFGNYNFPIFNIADTLIVVGVILLLIGVKGGNKHDNR